MDTDHDASSTDEYFMTAVQIFDYCGGQSSGTIRVDTLMDKFAPFVKTNNSEFGFLKSLLDPDHSNPEVTVGRLARALSLYSDRQKTNVDLEESFNLKSGPMPQDSDSGISADGCQLVEELQTELREKSHLMHQLRSQLEFTDRQHEEVVAALTAERDELRAHLTMLREENMSLTDVKRDYEEACDRLSESESALEEARRELEQHRKKTRTMDDRIQVLEIEKVDLQELLAKSRAECHRINEMYASRQSILLEENETIKAEYADLSVRVQDHDEFVQQIIREKVHLEMELRDVLNRSNRTQQRLDHSIDVSYSDDQMWKAMDTITADSSFVQENHLLDEEVFVNTLKEDQGRMTNVSLFDEIRLSISNASRQEFNLEEQDTSDDTRCELRNDINTSVITVGIQTELHDDLNSVLCPNCSKMQTKTQTSLVDIAVKTADDKERSHFHDFTQQKQNLKSIAIQTGRIELEYAAQVTSDTSQSATQTEPENNNNISCTDCSKCLECERRNQYTNKLENDLIKSRSTMVELKDSLDKYELNLDLLEKLLDDGNDKNAILKTVVQSLQAKLVFLEEMCARQKERIENVSVTCGDIENCFVEYQRDSDQISVGTQVEAPCKECVSRNEVSHSGLRRYLWEPLKTLFQMFAVVCFLCAVSVLYSVSTRSHARCREVPWRWLDAHEFIDMLLKIDYGTEVPM